MARSISRPEPAGVAAGVGIVNICFMQIPISVVPTRLGRTVVGSWTVASLGFVASVLWAATVPALAAQVSQESSAIRVFLDCQTRCDGEFVRQQIRFVSWVRDRTDADVHLLITSQRSGSGLRYDLSFIGRGRFAGDDVTLGYNSSDTDTTAERRESGSRVIGLGLARYVSQTQDADRLTIQYDEPVGGLNGVQTGESALVDPWNFWVFRIAANGGFSGESQQSATELSGSVSANRTTEALKVRLGVSAWYEENSFDLEEESYSSIARFSDASAYVAVSIREHMATGARFDLWSSTFSNIDLAGRAAWAFEYNVFPYSESTRRELTILYQIGLAHFRYQELTIYEKLEETLPDHALIAALDLKEPWGDARASVTGSQFLHDPGLYRVSARGGVEIRVFRGLSVDLSGQYDAVRDQISLRLEGASPEEVLLFRQELATDYRFRMRVGLTYRFGSIFNNVVNPRLDNFRRP